MKEVIDKATGAILFKSEPENPLEKKISILTASVERLSSELNELKSIVNTILNK